MSEEQTATRWLASIRLIEVECHGLRQDICQGPDIVELCAFQDNAICRVDAGLLQVGHHRYAVLCITQPYLSKHHSA